MNYFIVIYIITIFICLWFLNPVIPFTETWHQSPCTGNYTCMVSNPAFITYTRLVTGTETCYESEIYGFSRCDRLGGI